ncbi:MAG: MATE family efflux transporter [Candidatus Krumholzibacteriota bacterium]|nr:MATE family efflux transporter [Candidatus Krumholzibacteriota bacterium]
MKEKTKDKKALLTEGAIGGTLFRLTVPMVAGIMAMVAFNLTDTFFVGRLGTRELAALSFTFPVVLMLSRFSLGLGIGASAVISRAEGEGDPRAVRRLTTDSLSLAILLVFVFVVTGLLTIEPVFSALGASADLLPLVKQYMKIWYFGLIFVVFPMVSNNAIRAKGDTRTPALIMMVAVAINVVMDPLLIFGLGPFPRMELAGAAAATVIARAVTLVVSFYVVCYRKKMLTLAFPGLGAIFESWRRILYIGIPAALTKVIVPLGVGVVTGIISTLGKEPVAAFGVATRLEFFALAVIMALSSVLNPFVGQNQGAGRLDRVKAGIGLGNRFSVFWGILIFVLLGLGAEKIAGLFSRDPEVISGIVLFLRIVPLVYCVQGLFIISSSVLNVLHKPFHAAALSLLQIFALCIPLAWLGARFFELPGVFGGLAAAYLVSGIISYQVLRRVIRKQSQA